MGKNYILDFVYPLSAEEISIIALILSFVSAIATIFTIIEMVKQRRTSIKPELILEVPSTKVFVEDLMLSKENVRFLEEDDQDRVDDLNSPHFEKLALAVTYKLHNIGFGTAKYVRGQWSFDLKKVAKILNRIKPSNIEVEYSNKSIYVKKGAEYTSVLSTSIFDYRDYFDYIGNSLEGEKAGCLVPKVILESYVYYFAFKHKIVVGETYRNIVEYFEGMPKPVLTLKYSDFNDKSYSRKFRLSFILYSPFSEDGVVLHNKYLGSIATEIN